jgi:predicted RNase H-like HicB family nuclease
MSELVGLDELVVPITVDYLEEDKVYKVSCPVLQGCHAWGETLDEAIRAIPDNIRAMIEARRQNGSFIPQLFARANSQTVFILRMTPVV